MHSSGATQTLSEFRTELLRDIYRGHYRFVADNFDHSRFGFDVDPNVVSMDEHAAYLDYVLANLESFFAASLLFSDSASRELFVKLIKFRCLGSPHLRIQEDMTWTSVQQMCESVAQYETGPSSILLKSMFGSLSHHENIPTEDQPIALDCWLGNVAFGLGCGNKRQYFFDRDGVSIRPQQGDWIIDGGACFGDTGVFFACAAGPEGRVYSFEPLPAHFDVIALNIDQNKLRDRMFCIPKGLGDQTNQVSEIDSSLTEYASPGFSLANQEDVVPVITIDDFATLQQPEKIDFIKLDVEGFELATLRGAANSIARFRPKLAISLYHKPQDFFEIPIYLKMNYPFYRFHLDHYTIHSEETVLYAIAD
jgi:FkbM family methyltransferase